MGDSIYDKQPHLHPVLKELQAKFFPFSAQMYPEDFAQQYHWCPVQLPSGWVEQVNITRYKSGWSNSFGEEKQRLVSRIKSYYGAAMPPHLADWLKTTRPTAVFSGHGLPEEISLVCSQALKSGYKKPSEIDTWAWTWIGLDCNGLVCFYLIKLGTFSRVLHSHPSYPGVSKLAKSVSEINYDSVMLWVKQINPSEDNASKKRYKVRQNPSDDGAHIAVIDCWQTYGSSLYVTERGGANRFQGHVGIHSGIYDIVDAPTPGCEDEKAVWKVRAREPIHGKDQGITEKVFITRQMQAY